MAGKVRIAKTSRAHDGLCPLLGIPTGLVARASLGDELAAALGRGHAASLALVDVDEFDALNRLLGAERADDVLRVISRRVRSAAPQGALVVRLGGDVLALALPGLELEQALVTTQAICVAAGRSPVPTGRAAGKRLAYPTVSGGVAPVTIEPGAGAHELVDDAIARAQAALRRAKELGRGRVAAPPDDRMVLKTSYYSTTQLGRLRALSQRLQVPEAALLRRALEDLLLKHKDRRDDGPSTRARPRETMTGGGRRGSR